MTDCKKENCNLCNDVICLRYAKREDEDRFIIINEEIVEIKEGETVNQILTKYIGFPDLTKD